MALGILVALVVSLTLWPNHARRSARQALAEILAQVGLLYQAVMRRYLGEDAAAIEALKSEVSLAIRKSNDLLQFALEEAFGPMEERESLALLANQVERIFQAVDNLELAIRDSTADTYFRSFETDLERLEAGVSAALDSLSNNIATGKLDPEWPDLGGMIASLDQQAAQARKAGGTMNYPLDEILRFYFLLLSSRNLIGELRLLRNDLSEKLP